GDEAVGGRDPAPDSDADNFVDGGRFNGLMLDWLRGRGEMRRWSRANQVIVVFTGLQNPLGGCVANSVQRGGLIGGPRCTISDSGRNEELLFLHELGHDFGAAHNDWANPQPCGDAATGASNCAWETCLDGPCGRERLMDEPAAFCTLVGQYNYGSHDTFC